MLSTTEHRKKSTLYRLTMSVLRGLRSEPRAAGSGHGGYGERSEPRAAGSGYGERSEPGAAGSGHGQRGAATGSGDTLLEFLFSFCKILRKESVSIIIKKILS